jgi:hypothetical protein
VSKVPSRTVRLLAGLSPLIYNLTRRPGRPQRCWVFAILYWLAVIESNIAYREPTVSQAGRMPKRSLAKQPPRRGSLLEQAGNDYDAKSVLMRRAAPP